MGWFNEEHWSAMMEAWYGVPNLKREGEELDRKLAEFEKNMGFFGSGEFVGRDTAPSTADSSPPEKTLTVPLPAPAGATAKPPVKIGSLPKAPAWVWHVFLALTAAGIVHMAIYFYGR